MALIVSETGEICKWLVGCTCLSGVTLVMESDLIRSQNWGSCRLHGHIWKRSQIGCLGFANDLPGQSSSYRGLTSFNFASSWLSSRLGIVVSVPKCLLIRLAHSWVFSRQLAIVSCRRGQYSHQYPMVYVACACTLLPIDFRLLQLQSRLIFVVHHFKS